MKNPFKHEEPRSYPVKTFSGKVRFAYKGKLLEGRIIGEPYTDGMLINATRYYHVVVGDAVYEIPSHAIEEIRDAGS